MRKLKPFETASVLLFGLLIAWPLFSLFREAGFSAGSFAWSELSRVAAVTALQALLSVLGAFLLGLPVGILIGRSITPGTRATLLSLYSMPSLVVATSVLSFFQDRPWRYSLISVILAHSLLNAPYVALHLADGFRELPRAYLEAARGLGADTRALLKDFFLPFVRLNLSSAALQVFSLCWMSFTLVLLLGGGPPVSTLETEIYASFRMGDLALERGAQFAVAQVLLGALPAVLWVWVERKRTPWAQAIRASAAGPERSTGGKGWPGAGWILALPYVLFVKNAFFASADAWRSVLTSPEFFSSLGWSTVLGAGTAGFTLFFALIFALGSRRSRFVRWIANVPAGVSTLVLCAGFFFAYDRWIDLFSGSLLVIALIQSVVLLPMAFRWIYPRVTLEDQRRIEAARGLGATPMRAFLDVELWKWKRVLVRVFGLSWVWSVGEFAVIAFFAGDGKRELLPQFLARLHSRYAFDEAQVVAFVLLVFTWLVLRLMMARGGKVDVV